MSSFPIQEPTEKSDGKPDTAIVPYVKTLNGIGVRTLQSCAGHVHSDGTRSDGHLWFDADIDVDVLLECDEFSHVYRLYRPESCWVVEFPGLAQDRESLDRAMSAVIESALE